MKLSGVFTHVLAAAAAFTLSYFLFHRTAVAYDTPCASCYPMDCTTGIGGVDVMFAKSLVKDYMTNHWSAINKNCQTVTGRSQGGKDTVVDSRCVWFSLDSVKRFVYEIESQMCNNCTKEKPSLGIRIYFGEYPAAGVTIDGVAHPEYAGLHTLMMVPTYWDGKKDLDFDPGYFDADCQPKTIDAADSMIIALVPGTSSAPTGNNAMRNHGHLIPPPFFGYYDPALGNTFMNYADNQ